MISTAKMKVSVWTSGMSAPWIAMISSSPKPVHAENLLGDDRAAKDRRNAERDDGDDRDQAVAQHVDEKDDALLHALGARGAHIVLVRDCPASRRA